MIGIDIGRYAIKIAISKKTGVKSTISATHHAIIQPLARGKSGLLQRQQLIAELIKNIAPKEKAIALSIPTSAAILKTISVEPRLSDEALEGEVQLALIDLIPFPLDQVYVDFFRLEKKNTTGKQDIFIVATKKEIVDNVIANIKVKKLRQKAVDIEVAATGLLIERIKGSNYRNTYAVINIGYLSTNIYVFARNEILFSREIQIGGEHFTETIAQTMGLSLAEAEEKKLTLMDSIPDTIIENFLEVLTEQITSTFELYFTTASRSLSGIYLTGGGSLIPALVSTLKKDFPEQTVEMLPVAEAMRIGARIDARMTNALSSVAIGLALRD